MLRLSAGPAHAQPIRVLADKPLPPATAARPNGRPCVVTRALRLRSRTEVIRTASPLRMQRLEAIDRIRAARSDLLRLSAGPAHAQPIRLFADKTLPPAAAARPNGRRCVVTRAARLGAPGTRGPHHFRVQHAGRHATNVSHAQASTNRTGVQVSLSLVGDSLRLPLLACDPFKASERGLAISSGGTSSSRQDARTIASPLSPFTTWWPGNGASSLRRRPARSGHLGRRVLRAVLLAVRAGTRSAQVRATARPLRADGPRA